jgi:hypothetical protein
VSLTVTARPSFPTRRIGDTLITRARTDAGGRSRVRQTRGLSDATFVYVVGEGNYSAL